MPEQKAVLVTTQHRGVFFGYTEHGEQGGRITLRRARMAIYWSPAMRGVLGLAQMGPDAACRIGGAVDEIDLFGVTAVVACTPQAVERWEAAPWS